MALALKAAASRRTHYRLDRKVHQSPKRSYAQWKLSLAAKFDAAHGFGIKLKANAGG
jgi:hypothetical protein